MVTQSRTGRSTNQTATRAATTPAPSPTVVESVLGGFNRVVKEVRTLRYHCRCSRERLLNHLILLSAEDRDYLREEDGVIGADCVFCGAHYRFSREDLQVS